MTAALRTCSIVYTLAQVAVIRGTYLGIEFMSKENEGRGGSVINISSYAGIKPHARMHGVI